MPTKIVIGGIVLLALFLNFRSSDQSAMAGHATAPVEQGLRQVDSVLQEGLTDGTHQAMSDSFADGVSGSAALVDHLEAQLRELDQ